MKNYNSWMTLIEIIIATVIFVTIFWWIFSSIHLINTYVKESNIKISAMNLAKSWIEKINVLKTKKYLETPYDKWWDFIDKYNVWYYTLSWMILNKIQENQTTDFNNWEWPLDTNWNKKTSTEWLSFYRLIKIADFDIDKSNSTKENPTIFDCKLDNDECDFDLKKKYLSDPFLSWTILNNLTNNLTLEFSTWTIFGTPSLFVVYIWTWTSISMSTNIGTNNSWAIENVWQVMYIDFSTFSWNNYLNLPNKTLTISWSLLNYTFNFWDNVSIWWSLDKAILNLRNLIKEKFTDFTAYILYPNTCVIAEQLTLYDILKDTKFLFPSDFTPDCSDTSILLQNNKITLSWSYIWDYNENITINPTYLLKLNLDWSENNYNLFTKLYSSRATNFWVPLWNKWFSSIYSLWIKVLWIDNWEEKVEEYFQTYLISADYDFITGN